MNNKNNCKNCGRIVSDRRVCQVGRGCRAAGKPINKPITQTVTPQAEQPKPKLTNHIAILLDSSASISSYGLTDKVIEAYNAQITTIKEQAHKSGQLTYFSLYVFGLRDDAYRYGLGGFSNFNQGLGSFIGPYKRDAKIERRAFETHIEAAPFLTRATYQPQGNTPLLSCMAQAIDDLSQVKDAHDQNTSFLVLTLTDGEENASRPADIDRIAELIRSKQFTNRWTFAVAGPQQVKQNMASLGIPAGNLTVWETTIKGTEAVMMASNVGTQAYYASRSLGAASIGNFYSPDLSKVNKDTLQTLDDLNNKFRRFTITKKDCPVVNATGKPAVEISEFIEKYQPPFQLGKAFYELTKTEEVQDHKDLVILNKSNGEMYGGRSAKQLVGLPVGGTIKVRPSSHPEYKVFIQSTSTNRKLLAGTELLYRIET